MVFPGHRSTEPASFRYQPGATQLQAADPSTELVPVPSGQIVQRVVEEDVDVKERMAGEKVLAGHFCAVLVVGWRK
jgi:hypothetical protein